MEANYRINYKYNHNYDYLRKAKSRRVFRPSITLIIIAINIILFFTLLYGFGVDWTTKNIAIQPSTILHGERLWTIITNMFMHANFLHLFVNMLSLFFLGTFLERVIGKKRYIMIYLIAGIIASLAFVFLAAAFGGNLALPAVGASGAIFGLGGVLALITPKLPVYVFFIPVAMPLWIGVVVAFVVMWLISWVAGIPIGNTAHLGGLIAGVIYGLVLRLKYKKKVALLNKFLMRNMK